MRSYLLSPYVSGEFCLDGKVGGSWSKAGKFTDFRKYIGEGQNPRSSIPSQKTIFYHCWREDALFFAFKCYEKNISELVTCNTSYPRKATLLPVTNMDDYVEILIDPHHDHVGYFHVLANPEGKVYATTGKSSWNELWSEEITFEGKLRCFIDYRSRCWNVEFVIPFSWLGLKPGKTRIKNRIIGLNVNRHRSAGAQESYFFCPYSLSHTTQWTSSIVFDPMRFGHLVLADSRKITRRLTLALEYDEKRLKRSVRSVKFDFPCKKDLIPVALGGKSCQELHAENKTVKGRDFWIISPFSKRLDEVQNALLPELRDLRGYSFQSLDNEYDPGFGEISAGVDRKRLSICEIEKMISAVPFYFKYRRYCRGDFLKANLSKERPEESTMIRLKEKFADGFLGFWLAEWDSDLWHQATGAFEDESWRMAPEEQPHFPEDKKGSERLLRRVFELQKKHLWNSVFGMNCWRCIDHYGLEYGGKFAYIEVTPNGNPSHQIQIAFARGAAKQYGRFWGIYIAVMLGQSTVDYLKTTVLPSRWNRSPEGGTSVSLFRRILYVAYFSGATLMELEQPSMLFRYDVKKKISLSPHGEVFKEFLNFVSRQGERGTPYIPVGIVLDYYHGFSPPYQTRFAYGRSGLQTWFWTPYKAEDYYVKALFYSIFPWTTQRIERNGFCLVNSPFGDVFDVLVASRSLKEKVLSHYRVLLVTPGIENLSSIKNLLTSYVNKGGVILAGERTSKAIAGRLQYRLIFRGQDGLLLRKAKLGSGTILSVTPEMPLDSNHTLLRSFKRVLYSLVQEVLPVKVEGEIQYLVNRINDGWRVLLVNNKGVYHSAYEKVQYDRTESQKVKVIFPSDTEYVVDEFSGKVFQKRSITVRVPPGGVVIIKGESLKS